jgi:dipeptidyl aminopeptidase/acylaminoacyl peptidase
VTEKAAENNSGFIKLDELPERLPGADDKTHLYLLTLPEGIKRKITSGDKSITLNSISSDGSKILISKYQSDLNARPFYFTTNYILDLKTMELDSIFSGYWTASASFSPGGKEILFIGGPSLFGKTGSILADDIFPNESDNEAYIYRIKDKSVEVITKNFNPSIKSAYWSSEEDVIYFNTTDKSFQNLYRFDLSSKKFTKVELETEVLSSIDFAGNNSGAVYEGSSATVPGKVFYLNLDNNNSKLLYDPNKESFKNITTGKTAVWKFRNKRGTEIDGLVYYPPDFDESKKYPCIVYYYGGTTPVEQSFEGRYPKNIWAANGYIVYVLQPSGAIGYGQEFSALHVNDWGNLKAEEIIEGTKQFLSAHQFVDPEKVGCIGASYGGYMTLNVLTKSDIFAAAVSHAGISSLASYWGEGYRGYLYNSIAAANSFPWNRKDIYVDYSPLYNADKITTPLLLLHGASDTNVPVGESIQMFTALKLLGREVDFIQVTGQDHHIMEYKKRMKWTKTIIAWFDKYLKNEPQWYKHLYEEK